MGFSRSVMALSSNDEGLHPKSWFEVKCIINIFIISSISHWIACAALFNCWWKSTSVVISSIWNSVFGCDSVTSIHMVLWCLASSRQTGFKAIQPLLWGSCCTQLTVQMFPKGFGTKYGIHMKVTFSMVL